MGRVQRAWTNGFRGWFEQRRYFPAALLEEIAEAVGAGERLHTGEVCLAVESRLSPLAVLAGLTARARAEHVFSDLRVWDTQSNSGVLFYLLLAERRIEIVTDRAIAARVDASKWSAIGEAMHGKFAQGLWREGCLHGMAEAQQLLQTHFPSDGGPRPDELPDRPVLL